FTSAGLKFGTNRYLVDGTSPQSSLAPTLVSRSGMTAGLHPRSSVGGGQLVNAGGVVSTNVTAWLHELLLPQGSVATQVRVMVCGQIPFVTVVRMPTDRFPLQASAAVGVSKSQAEAQL